MQTPRHLRIASCWIGSIFLFSLFGCTAQIAIPVNLQCNLPGIGCFSPFVLGQPDFDTSLPKRSGFQRPTYARVYQGKFFVVDGSNTRVMIWNSVPTSLANLPDVVLGWNGVYDSNNADQLGSVVYKNRFAGPYDIAFAGTKMLLSDNVWHRILIWNTIPTKNYTAPDVVLGQPGFDTGTANNGGVSASSLNGPRGMYSDGTRLWVADYGNNRVLVWNTIPTTNNAPATGVLGQGSMTTNASNSPSRSASTFFSPSSVHSDGVNFFVSDVNNSRVLIWNSIPTTATAANWVLGQSVMTNGTCNSPGRTNATLCNPGSVFSTGSSIVVSDTNNHRLMVWNSIPAANGVAASAVLGQPGFTTGLQNNQNESPYQMSFPTGITWDGSKMYLGDLYNNRILVWRSVPSTSQTPADIELDIKPTNALLGRPTAVDSDGLRMVATDPMNNRVLIWNRIPSSTYAPADIVLGQPDFSSRTQNNGGVSAASLSFPSDAKIINGKLIVADSSNNRVLIWNTFPTYNQQPADAVLGQTLMTNNSSGATATTLSFPLFVQSNGNELLVADNANSRVLIWSTIPSTSTVAAQRVLGQPNLTSNTANNGGISAHSLRAPRGLFVTNNSVWVTDTGNHRVLRWNTETPATNQDADLVLGQPDFVTGTEYTGGISASSFSSPQSVYISDQELYIGSKDRFEVWTSIPETNFAPANVVYGQAGFDTALINWGGLNMNSLAGIHYRIWSDGNRIFLPDGINARIISFLRRKPN